MTQLSASVKRRGLSFRLTAPTMSQEVDNVNEMILYNTLYVQCVPG